MFTHLRMTPLAIAALVAFSAASAGAQQPGPKLRPLGSVISKSADLLDAVSTTRQLPDGRLLVNDISGRKLVLFEKDLTKFTVLADTTSATGNAYSSRAGGLIAWKGDSSLFVDPQSLSMIVIDANGKLGRSMAAPHANDVGLLIGGPTGTPGIDATGRLVYRAQPRFRMAPPAPGSNGMPAMPAIPDSTPLVRYDLAARKLDTVTFLKTAKANLQMSQDDKGRMNVMVTMNPMPNADDWALLSDGSIAVIRSQDYHIDWTKPNGEKTSTGKMSFDWKRLSDEDKVAFLDSARTAMERLRQNALSGNLTPAQVMGGQTAVQSQGQQRFERGGDAGGPPRAITMGSGQNAVNVQPINMVPPSDLPDYAPPFSPGAARGDMDGNLWIRTSKVVSGGSEYDVINTKGEIVDRVLMPAGRVIAGFGRDGIVYMGVREEKGVRLEMAKFR
jgi:hypothetical protein